MVMAATISVPQHREGTVGPTDLQNGHDDILVELLEPSLTPVSKENTKGK